MSVIRANGQDLNSWLAKLEKRLAQLPVLLANEALNFVFDRFREQGWLENTSGLQPWAPRKRNPDPGRAILVQTGRLRRSIRIALQTAARVVIEAGGQEAPYARIHNEGGIIQAVQRIRSHTRTTRYGTQQVKAHIRNVRFTMPKRQFMGYSQALERRLIRVATDFLISP